MMRLAKKNIKITSINVLLVFKNLEGNVSITEWEKEDMKMIQIQLVEIKTISEMKNTLDRYKGHYSDNFSVY